MLLSSLARPVSFFDLFEEKVSPAAKAARFFKEVTQDRVSEEMLSKMAQIEH
jgi:hypothetical protein